MSDKKGKSTEPRFAAACRCDDVILVVYGAAAEEGPAVVIERHQERKLDVGGAISKFYPGGGFHILRPQWMGGRSPKSRRKEQNQLICDRGGSWSKNPKIRHIWKPPGIPGLFCCIGASSTSGSGNSDEADL